MAKARKKTAAQLAHEAQLLAEQRAQSAEIGLDPDDEDEDAEQDVLAELRGLGAGEGFRYAVSRVARKPGEQQGYCSTFNSGDLSLDAIRDQFGGGKFRIRVLDEGGRYKGTRTVEIVDLPKPAAPPAAAAPAAAPALDLAGLAQVLAAGRPAAAAGDSGMAAVLAAMIASQGEMMKSISAQSKGPSVTEILAIVKAGNGGGGEKSTVDLLLQGIELGKSLSGGGEAGAYDVAKQGLDLVASLASKQPAPVQPVQLPPRAPVQIAAPAASTTAPAAAQGEQVGLLQKIEWLRKQTATLVYQASRDRDPELYAEVMLDNLPAFIAPEEILQRLQAPGAIEQLAQLDARVRDHAEWFEEFRQAACDILLAPDEDPEMEAAPDAALVSPVTDTPAA